MQTRTTTFLKLALFIIGITMLALCVFWLPRVASSLADQNPEFAHLRYPVQLGLYVTGIPFYFALFQALKLLNLIKGKNAFSELAVDSLKHIKYSGAAIIVAYVLGMVYLIVQNALHPGIAILALGIIFASATISFFAAVLQELLRSALEIKSENDLTV